MEMRFHPHSCPPDAHWPKLPRRPTVRPPARPPTRSPLSRPVLAHPPTIRPAVHSQPSRPVLAHLSAHQTPTGPTAKPITSPLAQVSSNTFLGGEHKQLPPPPFIHPLPLPPPSLLFPPHGTMLFMMRPSPPPCNTSRAASGLSLSLSKYKRKLRLELK